MNNLEFRPHLGLSSGHLQTVLAAFRVPLKAPPTTSWQVSLGANDSISCEISTPKNFDKVVVLVHGLGGSHASNYMVRMARKLYDKDIKAVRVNMRGCGSGKGLSHLPYHGGRSQDLLAVLQALKSRYPTKDIYAVGFSLGANVVLKLAGELGSDGSKLLKTTIGVCCPVDLAKTVYRMQQRKYHFYHSYFLKKVCEQAKPWLHMPITSIYEFDDKITAPLWGFSGAEDYYKKSSCLHFLPEIKHTCHLLFAEDDPFVPLDVIKSISKSSVNLWTTKHGGHMGFLGKALKEHKSQWLDQQLLHWIDC